MPSNMVTEEVDRRLSTPEPTHAIPLPTLAVSPVPPSQLFPLSKWAPRSGRTDSYETWWRGVVQLGNAFGIIESDLRVIPSHVMALYANTQHAAADAAGDRQEPVAALTSEQESWLATNTALYWHGSSHH